MRPARSRTYTRPSRPTPTTPTFNRMRVLEVMFSGVSVAQLMNPLVDVQGVRKAFPGVVALDDVSMQVRAGTVHALMGENGAGKSTLMKIIAGLDRPDAGRITL